MKIRLILKVFDNENPAAGHAILWKLADVAAAPNVGDPLEGFRVESVSPSDEGGVACVVDLGTAETQFGWSVDQLALRGWETE